MGQHRPKFKDGDRVQMTQEARDANPGSRSFAGVVVGKSRLPFNVRIRKDGQKTIMLWHENAWEPLATMQKGERVE